MPVGEDLQHDQVILLGGSDIDRIQGITDGVGMFIDPVDPTGVSSHRLCCHGLLPKPAIYRASFSP